MRRIVLLVAALTMAAVAGCAQPHIYNAVGNNAFNKQDYDTALDSYKTGANQYPADAGFQNSTGRVYLELGQYDKAIKYFRRAVELSPSFVNYAWLGSAYFRTGAYDKSLEAYTAFNGQLDPANEAILYLSLSDIYLKLGQLDKAAGAAQRLVNIKPDIEGYNRLSNILNHAGRYDEAIETCNKAVETDPNNATAYNNMGWAFAKKRMFQQAVKLYNKALELSPKDPAMLINQSDAYYEAGRLKKAVEFAEKATQINPAYKLTLANYHFLGGTYDEAIRISDDTIKTGIIEGGIGVTLKKFGGESYLRIISVVEDGPAKRAGLMVADKIVEVDGNSVKNEEMLAVLAKIKGQAGTSVKIEIEREDDSRDTVDMEKVITRDVIYSDKSSIAAAFGIKSSAFALKGEAAQAKLNAAKAVEIMPNEFWPRYSLGLTNLADNKFEEAAKSFSLCLENNRESKSSRILLALAYARLDKFPEALAAYREVAVDEIPDGAVSIKNYLGQLHEACRPFLVSLKKQADDAVAKGNYKEALAYLAKAYEVPCEESEKSVVRGGMFALLAKTQDIAMPDEVRKYDVRANLLMQEKDHRGALAEYKKALKVAPYLPALYYNTAVIYSELRDYGKAIENMRIYVATLPKGEAREQAEDDVTKWELMMEKAAVK